MAASGTLDVLLLGRDEAITLGIDHRRVLTRVLVFVALLVSISTVLSRPVTFLGLLVANLAYRVMPTYRHAVAMTGLLRRAVDQRDRTIVAVLHDINFVSCCSDRIVAMRDGEVMAVGPPEEIVTPDVLRAVYATDVEVVTVRGYRTVFFYR